MFGTGIFLLFLPCGTSCVSAQEPLSLSGITEPYDDVILSFPIPGMIDKIHFKEGSYVKKRQVILNLDLRMEILEVKRRKLFWESKAELEAANTRVATLKPILDATVELYQSTGSVSKEDLDELELEYKLAVAEVRRLEIAEDQQKIEYEMARVEVDKRKLKSPISGIITKLFMDEGESAEKLQHLVQVVDVSRCRLVCTVEEPIGRTLKEGQIVNLRIRMGSASVSKEGTIVLVSPVVDAASGLLEVKVEFDNQDKAVRPGVTGEMILDAP